MSSLVANLMLALLSLKKELQEYLNDNSWNDNYTLFIAGDPTYVEKEVVSNVTNSRTQMSLPIITIEAGTVRNEVRELGNEYGTDLVTITFLICAEDMVQLISLGNLIRQKVNNMSFTIYDYHSSSANSVGTGLLTDPVLNDISNYGSDSLFERHVSLINTTLEFDAESFI